MSGSDARSRPCPRCGALNGASFDRCVRCNAGLQPLAAGADALKIAVDPSRLLGTKVLLGLTVLVFAGQLAWMLKAREHLGLGGALAKIGFMYGGTDAELMRFGALRISIEDTGEAPYRLLSAVFVHIGVLHVLMNMLSLVNIGRVVEPGVGSARFVVAYLTCGVLGFATNLAVELVFPHRGVQATLTAGASGAVFGVMGMMLGFLLQRRDKRWRSIAVQTAFYAVIVNLMFLRTGPGGGISTGINNGAHLGGLFVGVLLGFYFAARPRPRSQVPANLGAILGLVLSVASLVLAQLSAMPDRRTSPVAELAPCDQPPAAQARSCRPTAD